MEKYKMKRILIIGLLLLCCLVLFSCSKKKENEEEEPSYIGTWIQDGTENVLVLATDGTASYNGTKNSISFLSDNMQYSEQEGVLYISAGSESRKIEYLVNGETLYCRYYSDSLVPISELVRQGEIPESVYIFHKQDEE